MDYKEMKSLIARKKRRNRDVKKLCTACGYEWKPKVTNPVACPRCKARRDITRASDVEK